MKKRNKQKKKQCKGCEYCQNLIAIGEGDHICLECGMPKMVICEYTPTDEYMSCGGRYYEE